MAFVSRLAHVPDGQQRQQRNHDARRHHRRESQLTVAQCADEGRHRRAVIEHKLYWAAVSGVDEARYLTAILNSDLILNWSWN